MELHHLHGSDPVALMGEALRRMKEDGYQFPICSLCVGAKGTVCVVVFDLTPDGEIKEAKTLCDHTSEAERVSFPFHITFVDWNGKSKFVTIGGAKD